MKSGVGKAPAVRQTKEGAIMSSINNGTDYAQLANQIRLNNANALLGGGNNASIAGISGDALQQWAMLGANSSAYEKLLEAQKTGQVKKGNGTTFELAADKYFNENYDAKTKTYTKPKYVSIAEQGAAIDPEKTSGDQLNDMRTLALAAIGNEGRLSSTHYDLFEKMRQNIASNFNSKGSSSSSSTSETTEATAASAKKTVDYRLLLDDQSFTVAGNAGEKAYTFGVGSSLEDVVSAINADTAETGVKAELVETDGGKYEVAFTSAATGKDQFVRIDQTRGDLFAAAGSSISGKGTDAVTKEVEDDVVATGEDTQAALAAGTPYGKLFEDNAFTIQGTKGSYSFSFEKGTTVEDIAAAINAQAEKTGVKAELIRGEDGAVEGLGLLAEKAGAGNYVQVKQDAGELFAIQGRTVSVAGSSVAKQGNADSGPAINRLEDLGKVNVNGQTYSFADLAPGGKASLAENPDAALAVLDQAIKDIYEGKAEIKGFDPSEMYVPGVTTGSAPDGAKASTNTMEYNNYGSSAISNWLKTYVVESDD